jgi:uncharacterized protein (TIGR02145 family)
VDNLLSEDIKSFSMNVLFQCGNNVSFVYKGSSVTYGTVINPITSECWLNRNLGATQVAISSTDANAYGDLFQWGRLDDSHQTRTSATTGTLSTSDTPGHASFITSPNPPYDWRNPQNNNLWQGADGINNPCPTGWRIPTAAEWDTERLSWSSNNATGALVSPLKLTVAGNRKYKYGDFEGVGSFGFYLSSTVSGTVSTALRFYSTGAGIIGLGHVVGSTVRCIKD